ncbi:DEAD-box ATP-dependent RNA helicase 25 [Diplonema papillatum]|nr:DEAD-box ATP-dependent RNA helicase 25 [Diplonema papillatum]
MYQANGNDRWNQPAPQLQQQQQHQPLTTPTGWGVQPQQQQQQPPPQQQLQQMQQQLHQQLPQGGSYQGGGSYGMGGGAGDAWKPSPAKEWNAAPPAAREPLQQPAAAYGGGLPSGGGGKGAYQPAGGNGFANSNGNSNSNGAANGNGSAYGGFNASDAPILGQGGYGQGPDAGTGKKGKGGKKGGKGFKGAKGGDGGFKGGDGGFKGGDGGFKGGKPGYGGGFNQDREQPEAGGRAYGGGDDAVPPASLSTSGYPPPARANPNSRTTSTTMSQITTERFADLPIDPTQKQALSDVLCYEYMTQVQAKTINVSLSGSDLLAKAKTGTGKTLAFLIPSLERTLQVPFHQRRNCVSVLVVSPTRELACQIDAEADQLIKFTGLSHLVVYGGYKIYNDLSAMRQRVPDLLVGTPGRLNDHLAKKGLASKASRLLCLILDEADQLLEMGFRPDITLMLSLLPPRESRQTLLFSATMPDNVMSIARVALRQNFAHIDCVGKESDTHQHVPQSFLIHPIETQIAELMQVINEGMQEDPEYKMLVFFTTARVTQFFAELFNKMNYSVLEMHSRKTQAVRTQTSDCFRDSTKVIMFTSDVTARGMDYPDVSKVIQVGLPADKQQYVHRLGRTARAGKSGNGVLLLSDFEEIFVRDLGDQQMQARVASPRQTLDRYQQLIDRTMSRLPFSTRAAAYQAWLGFYNSNLKKLRWSREKVVEVANHWITSCCQLSEPPALLAKTVAKMQLSGVPGIITERSRGGHKGGGDFGGKGGFSGGGKGGGKGGKGGGKGGKKGW